MGVDVHTYAERDGKLIETSKLGIDWAKVLGHPMREPFTTYDGKPSFWDIEPGYIREAYHGFVRPTVEFIPESYEHESYETFAEKYAGDYNISGVHIPLVVLKERLPKALEQAWERRCCYKDSDRSEAGRAQAEQPYRDFVKVHETIGRGDMRPIVYNSY